MDFDITITIPFHEPSSQGSKVRNLFQGISQTPSINNAISQNTMSNQIWLVTGATSGLGKALVQYVLSRGDKVVASGRKTAERLADIQHQNLAFLELDISASYDSIRAQVDTAWDIFGKIDILVNNAGISAMKSAEESEYVMRYPQLGHFRNANLLQSTDFVNNMFQANVFGHMHVTNAILPRLREQGYGRIAFISSSTAWAPLPFMSTYSASKAALSTYAEALDKETRPLSIRCVAIECGGFPTNLGQPRDTSSASFGSNLPAIEAYGPMFQSLIAKIMENPKRHMPGDIEKAAATFFDIVKSQGSCACMPWAVRVAVGSDAMIWTQGRCKQQLQLADAWAPISANSDADHTKPGEANDALAEFLTVIDNA